MNIGDNVFVRTDTDHWTGRIVSIDGPYTVTLTDFAWIADSGRLGNFLRSGVPSEAEAAPDGMTIRVTWRAVLSWPHPLIRRDV